MSVPFIDTWVANGPFAIVQDTELSGGYSVVLYNSGTALTAVQTAIPNVGTGISRRKRGQIVRAIHTGTDVENWFQWDGTDFIAFANPNAAQQFPYGFAETSDWNATITGGGTQLTFAAGTLYDFYGIPQSAPAPFTPTVAPSSAYAVYWNPVTRAVEISIFAPRPNLDKTLSPICVIITDVGGLISTVTQFRFKADGTRPQVSGVLTVGDITGGPNALGASFDKIWKAAAWLGFFDSDQSMPKTIMLTADVAATQDDITSGQGLVEDAGLTVTAKPGVVQTVQGAYWLNDDSNCVAAIRDMSFEMDQGTAGNWLENPATNLVVENCVFSGDYSTARLILWGSTVGIGNAQITNVRATNVFENDPVAGIFFLNSLNAAGSITVENCSFTSGSAAADGPDSVFYLDSATSLSIRMEARDCTFGNISAALCVNSEASDVVAPIVFDNCRIVAATGAQRQLLNYPSAYSGGAGGSPVILRDCLFDNAAFNVSGASEAMNCWSNNSALIRGHHATNFSGCRFDAGGSSFVGDFLTIDNCTFDLKDRPLTGTVARPGTSALTGTTTAFLSQLEVGDVIHLSDTTPSTNNITQRRVATLVSDTAGTVAPDLGSGDTVAYGITGCLNVKSGGAGARYISNSRFTKTSASIRTNQFFYSNLAGLVNIDNCSFIDSSTGTLIGGTLREYSFATVSSSAELRICSSLINANQPIIGGASGGFAIPLLTVDSTKVVGIGERPAVTDGTFHGNVFGATVNVVNGSWIETLGTLRSTLRSAPAAPCQLLNSTFVSPRNGLAVAIELAQVGSSGFGADVNFSYNTIICTNDSSSTSQKGVEIRGSGLVTSCPRNLRFDSNNFVASISTSPATYVFGFEIGPSAGFGTTTAQNSLSAWGNSVIRGSTVSADVDVARSSYNAASPNRGTLVADNLYEGNMVQVIP